jgi:hypothetical protein
MLSSARRRLKHLLRVGSAVKACTAPRTQLSATQHAKLEEELTCLRKTNKAAKAKAIADMELSARPRKQAKLSKFTKNKDVIDMDYTRMLVTAACKSGFMESQFLAAFFFKYFNYEVPKRTTEMGPLLDAQYKDTKKKVLAVYKFDDADSLCTISMDGWVSPTGEHIRNYVSSPPHPLQAQFHQGAHETMGMDALRRALRGLCSKPRVPQRQHLRKSPNSRKNL